MTISQQVLDCLDEAEKHLRNALAFAARTEEAWVAKHITSAIMGIKGIPEVDAMTEHLQELRDTLKGPFDV